MNKKFFVLSVFPLLFSVWSCKPEAGKPRVEPAAADTALTGQQLLEQLRATAVDESDIPARLRSTVLALQEEFDRSEAAGMTGIKKVKVAIEGDCILAISNNAFGKEVTRVNLKDLDHEGLSLIPDVNEGDYPGLRIQTYGLKETVELYKNGTLALQKSEWVIYMADRQAIERITPYMVQALNICQGVPIPD